MKEEIKQISIKITKNQYDKLQLISEHNKIYSVSSLIRRAIDLYIITQGKEGSL